MYSDISILVVEDELVIRESLCSLLSKISSEFRHSIQIHCASNVVDALKLVRKQQVDVVLLDYYFNGGMTGNEFIERLPESLDSLYIVLISSREPSELDSIVRRHHIKLDSKRFPFRFLAKANNHNDNIKFPLLLQDIYQSAINFTKQRQFPTLLAHSSQAVDEAENGLERLMRIKDFLEASMKYLTNILLSDYYYRNARSQVSQNMTNGAGYGFGFWERWLHRLSKQKVESDITDFVPEIFEFLSMPIYKGEKAFGFLSRFKDFRDKHIAHGISHDLSFYDKKAMEFNDPFNKFRDFLSFCKKYPLIVVKNVDFAEQGCFQYSTRLLMGLDLYPPERRFCSSKKLLKSKVYISNSRGDFLKLHPFTIFHHCDQCGVRRTFIVESYKKRVEYIALCSHRILSDDVEEFQRLLGL